MKIIYCVCELRSEELNGGWSSQLYTQLFQLRKKSLNPAQAWIFFRLPFCNWKSCVYNCDDHPSFSSSSQLRKKSLNPAQAWIFFRLSFCNCKSCVNNGDDHPSFKFSLSSSHIWFSYIQNFIIILSQVYNKPIQWPAPSWLVSLNGRALHRYRRGQGFESRTNLNFSLAFFSQLQKLRI